MFYVRFCLKLSRNRINNDPAYGVGADIDSNARTYALGDQSGDLAVVGRRWWTLADVRVLTHLDEKASLPEQGRSFLLYSPE